jgi:cell wall assembly regulator SMI1
MNDKISNTYNELLKFSNSILTLEKPILDNRIETFEEKIGFKFPEDFVYFIKQNNGFTLGATEVNGIGLEYKEASLDRLYDFEHNEAGNHMPKEFLPFSADGFGNHYCLDLTRIKNEFCPVMFWQHDFEYKNVAEVETCNESFVDWVNEVMIEWTLEEYNYDGTEK